MNLYCIDVPYLNSDAEGEDCREWYTDLAAAKKRIRELLRLTDGDWAWRDIRLSRYRVAKLPRRKLILALLRRSAWASAIEEIARYEIPTPEPKETQP